MEEVKTVIDNTKDWYDLVDTALKIGLGAFIGGAFSFLTLKSAQKYEVSKEKRAYKIKTLDEASSIIENYFNHSFKLLDCWYGLTYENKFRFSDLSEENKKKIRELDKNYTNSIQNAQSAISKFNIIGLNSILNLTQTHDKNIIGIRNNFVLGREPLPNHENIMEIIDVNIDLKNQCHYEINQYFENLK